MEGRKKGRKSENTDKYAILHSLVEFPKFCLMVEAQIITVSNAILSAYSESI